MRNTYFGEVIEMDFRMVLYKNSLQSETDLSVGYDITKKVNFTIGANNLFDVFPDLQSL